MFIWAHKCLFEPTNVYLSLKWLFEHTNVYLNPQIFNWIHKYLFESTNLHLNPQMFIWIHKCLFESTNSNKHIIEETVPQVGYLPELYFRVKVK